MIHPMPVERYEALVEAAIDAYASDNVASGRWPASQSMALARGELERLLPEGHATPDHRFFDIVGERGGARVGFVWFAEMPRGDARIAYVYQLFVDPPHRRRGHARSALLEVEALARASGLTAVALNVFGHNHAAQALYRSLGFATTSLSMQKALAADAASGDAALRIDSCPARTAARPRRSVRLTADPGEPGDVMATKYGKAASKKVETVMREKNEGTLKSGRSGKAVKSRNQAIAIGLSEARKEGAKVPPAPKKAAKKTAAKKTPAKKSTRKTVAKKTARKSR